MEPVKNVLEGLLDGSATGEDVAARNRIARLKRMAHDGEAYRSEATEPAEALFYYAAASLYANDTRAEEVRRMEMHRLEVAYVNAERQLGALRKMAAKDAWKARATEEARTKIRRKKAGKDVPESWEDLAVLLAGILDNVPEAREETA